MKRRYLAVPAILVLFLRPSTSSADPASWGQLGQIIAWLQQIDRTLAQIESRVYAMRTKFADVYPRDVLRRIDIAFEPVDSIKAEVEKLACNWRFTPRVDQLRLALFRGGSFCRRDWDALFGAPTLTADWDLEHYYDWSAVRRLNLIRTRYEKGPERAAEAEWLAREAMAGRDALDGTKPYSPGYSQRLSAMAAAELGNVMVETGDTQTAMLELDQEALNAKRRNRLLAHESAALVYLDMARRAQSQVQPPGELDLLGDRP
jgi:hypothetical protein